MQGEFQQHNGLPAAGDPAIQQRLDAVGHPELPGCVTRRRLGGQAVCLLGTGRDGRWRRGARSGAAAMQQMLAGVISPRRAAVGVAVQLHAGVQAKLVMEAGAARWIGVGEAWQAVGRLGLSIVRAIATAHTATITAQPRPGGGLAIDVTFPPTPATAPRVAPDLA